MRRARPHHEPPLPLTLVCLCVSASKRVLPQERLKARVVASKGRTRTSNHSLLATASAPPRVASPRRLGRAALVAATGFTGFPRGNESRTAWILPRENPHSSYRRGDLDDR